ncbi:MAG: GNAT family N-acetyltransferase [Chloroflexota bacterium]|nr:MAG: GNAT family N-acetyltransferase [Chloroflexota bacterium]
MNIPQLETFRLILRPFTQGDVEPLHRILGIPGVLQYFPNSDTPGLDRVKRLVQRQINHWSEFNYGWWAVETKTGSGLIGWSGLQYLPETNETEIGYLFAKPYWGQGLASESASAGLDYGFTRLKIPEIVGIVHPENIASRRVLEKIGLKHQEQAEYFGMVCEKYLIKNPY